MLVTEVRKARVEERDLPAGDRNFLLWSCQVVRCLLDTQGVMAGWAVGHESYLG